MDTTKNRDKTHEATLLFVIEVVAWMEALFPDAGIMNALTPFDPSQISQDDHVRNSTLL